MQNQSRRISIPIHSVTRLWHASACRWLLLLAIWLSAASANALVSGTKTTLVMLVNLNDAPIDCTIAEVSGMMFTNSPVNVDSYFDHSTWGNVRWSGTVISVSINFSKSPCNDNAWSDAADLAAIALGYDPSAYTARLYAFPSAAGNCGYAYASGNRVGNYHCSDLFAFGHEVGHTIGMHHASSDPNNDGVVDSEYGGLDDCMGNESFTHNAPHKIWGGWLPERTNGNGGWRTISAEGVYRIAPLELNPTNALACSQAYRIDVPHSATVNDPYFLSYRQALDFDQGWTAAQVGKDGRSGTSVDPVLSMTNYPYAYGVGIHRHNGQVGIRTREIDVLGDSGTFVIPELGWAITQLSHGTNNVAFYLDPAPGVVGLTASYYDNADFTALRVVRNDPTLDFNWNTNAPAPGVAAEDYSVRWAGYVRPATSGGYTFYITADAGVRLWVNGLLVLDQWNNTSLVEYQAAEVSLIAGQNYDLQIEYAHSTGPARVRLAWSSDTVAKSTVPGSVLFPAQPAGVGLTARYYDTTNFTTIKALTIDPVLWFAWGSNAPKAGMGSDTYSVRWTGQVQSTYSETYTFYAIADKGVRLWVNGTLLVDQWNNSSSNEFSGTIALTAGQRYDVQVDYFEDTGDSQLALMWSSASQSKQLVSRSHLFPEITGTGLLGEYYPTINLTGAATRRIDSALDFDWGGGAPIDGFPVDNFSVRWTGKVLPAYSENYTFYTTTDDGVRLWVNNVLVIDKWVDQNKEWSSTTIALTAGQLCDIKMEYYEHSSGASASLSWSSASQGKQAISASQWYLPVTNTAPVLAAITDKSVDEGSLLSFTASATDTDSPPQTLTYSLEGAPGGATINPASGAVTWTPQAFQGPATNLVTVRVADTYNVSDSATFAIVVNDTQAPFGGPGTGLFGQYFDNIDLTAPKMSRVDPRVNFNWGEGSPDPSIDADTFSVRWTGWIQPLFSETCTFYTTTDDGVRLWINNQLIIDKWTNQAPTEWSGTIALVAGQKYAVRLEYFENGAGAQASLSWSSASQPKQIVPQSRLFPDNTPPQLAPIGNQTVNRTTQLSFTATAADPDPGQLVTFTLDAGAPAGATLTTNGVFSWTPTLAQGPAIYRLTIRCSDGAGGTDAETFVIIVTDPVQTYVNGLLAEYFDGPDFSSTKITRTDSNVNFNWGAGSPDPVIGADSFSVRWTGQVQPAFSETYTFYTTSDDGARLWVNGQLLIDKWVNQGATEWSGSLALVGGQKYDIVMEYFDDQAGASASLSWSSASQAKQIIPSNRLFYTLSLLNASNTPPVMDVLAVKIIRAGSPLNFAVAATDPDPGQVLAFTLDPGAPAGAAVSTSGWFTWTPSPAQAPSTNLLTVNVSDGAGGTDSKPLLILVNPAVSNTAPVLTAISNQTVLESTLLTFVVTATDTESQALNFSLDSGAPAGATINPASGVFTWTPTEAQGGSVYPITARVTDIYGAADTKVFQVTVTKTNSTPVLAPIGNRTIVVHAPYSFTAVGTDSDLPAQALTYSLEAGAPAGTAIHPTTGVFTWTPAATGTNTLTVRVTDSQGAFASETIQVVVIVPSEVLNGIVGFWKFDDGSGILATDSSGNTNTGYLSNSPAWTAPGKVGPSALAFNASSLQAVIVPNATTLNASTGLTISAWVNATNWTGNRRIVQKGNSDNQYRLLADSGFLKIHLNGVGSLTAALPPVNTWVHIAATWNRTNLILYTNGIQLAILAAGGSNVTTLDPLAIGKKFGSGTTGDHFLGRMDDVRVYNRGLTPTEVAMLAALASFTNALPTLTPIGNKTGVEQSPLTFTATATDPDLGQTLAFSLDAGAPAGAIINSSNGLFTWLPPGPGTNTVTVRVTDSAGGSAAETIQLIITPSADVLNGLVAYWRFDETSGTTALDSSTNGNNGTLLNGPTWSAPGKVGTAALSFNPTTSQSVTAANAASLNPTAGITICAWVNAANWTGGNRRILQKGNGDNQYRLLAETGVLKFHLNGVNTLTTTLPPLNTWVHIVATWNGSTMILYSNGVQRATLAAGGAITTTTDALAIGKKNGSGNTNDYFFGTMDDVRIYNRALSLSEITTVMNIGNPPAAPTGLSATAGNAQVSLSWNAVPNATGYTVKRSLTNGGPYALIASPSIPSCSNTGLANGTTFYYVVSALNAVGESPDSAQVSATPHGAPTTLFAVRQSNELVLTWSNGSGPYQVQMKTNLADADWITVTDPLATNGLTIPTTNPAAFFRILSQ